MKAVVTRNIVNIEPKGIDAFSVSNYNNYVFLSNRDTPLPIEADDRRFYVIEISNKYVENVSYFQTLFDSCTDKAAEVMFLWLANRDISKFNPRVRPYSRPKTDMKLDNLPYVHKMVIELVKGEFVNEIWNGHIAEGFLTISSNEMFTVYQSWCGANNIQFNLTRDKFGKDLSKVKEMTKYRVGAWNSWMESDLS